MTLGKHPVYVVMLLGNAVYTGASHSHTVVCVPYTVKMMRHGNRQLSGKVCSDTKHD